MRLRTASIALLSCMAACTTETTGASYKVGGLVTGLTSTAVLMNNGRDALLVTGTGAFTFATPIASGSTYSVTVSVQPTDGLCTVFDGKGTVNDRHITTVAVTCTPNDAGTTGATTGSPTGTTTGTTGGSTGGSSGSSTGGSSSTSTGGTTGGSTGGAPVLHYSVGGQLSGLGNTAGSVTVANGADTQQLSHNGGYVVSSLPTGTPYHVAVSQAPAGWACTVANPNGTVGNANVTNVNIACGQVSYNVRGVIAGHSGDVLITDTDSQASVTAHAGDTTFELTGYQQADAYSVAATPPAGEICQVRNGSGLVCSGDAADVIITCGAPVALSGAVAGQSSGLVVAVNGRSLAPVAQTDTSYQVTNLVGGAPYSVTIQSQPAGQKCGISNHAGIFGNSNIAGVDIQCADANAVSGMLPSVSEGIIFSVTDGTDTQLVQIHGNPAQYSLPIAQNNGSWSVSLYASPLDQLCTLATASGADLTSDVTGVDVSCSPATHAVSGILRVSGGATGSLTISDGTSSVTKSGDYAGWGLSGYASGTTAHLSYTFTGFSACASVPSTTDFVPDAADIAGVIVTCQ